MAVESDDNFEFACPQHQDLVDDIKAAQVHNGGYIWRNPYTGNGVLSLDKIAEAVLGSNTLRQMLWDAWELGWSAGSSEGRDDVENPYGIE
jgi:hypothetical protein